MTQKSNKKILHDFFENYNASELDKLFWEMYTALLLSKDFDHWPPIEKVEAANLYKDVTSLIYKLELSNFKTNLS